MTILVMVLLSVIPVAVFTATSADEFGIGDLICHCRDQLHIMHLSIHVATKNQSIVSRHILEYHVVL